MSKFDKSFVEHSLADAFTMLISSTRSRFEFALQNVISKIKEFSATRDLVLGIFDQTFTILEVAGIAIKKKRAYIRNLIDENLNLSNPQNL